MELQSLKELHAAVKAGTDTAHHHANAFPSESAYGHCTWHDSHKASTQSDLNAARALHDALLPGWAYGLCFDAHNEKYAFVSDGDFETDEEYSECHARAWLQAVLAALLFQAEVKE